MDVFVDKRRHDGTVFIIDNDAAMQDSLQAMFEVRGLRVECFDSGRSFQARRDRGARGCVVLNLDAPESGGLALLRVLTAEGGGLPVIVLSNQISGTLRVKVLAAGAVACLDKPFEPAHLLDTVFQALPAVDR